MRLFAKLLVPARGGGADSSGGRRVRFACPVRGPHIFVAAVATAAVIAVLGLSVPAVASVSARAGSPGPGNGQRHGAAGMALPLPASSRRPGNLAVLGDEQQNAAVLAEQAGPRQRAGWQAGDGGRADPQEFPGSEGR
jgi:hypothetical protein